MFPALAQHRMLPTLLLLVAAASWGGNWVAARSIHLEVPPFALSFWRWALASAMLLPFVVAQLREDAQVGFFNPVIPVFGTLFAVSFLGEPLRPYHLAGFALVLGGVILTSRR